MRIVLQRVRSASVSVADREIAAIGRGYLLLVGIEKTDTPVAGERLARKIAALRLFPDAAGRMSLPLREVGGAVLVVSQFTLLADLARGNRPDFHRAAPPATARTLYDAFLDQLRAALGPDAPALQTGEFGADMRIALVNDGPVTLVLD